jgi:hypothetical protein
VTGPSEIMKDGVDTDDNVQRGDSDGVVHPSRTHRKKLSLHPNDAFRDIIPQGSYRAHGKRSQIELPARCGSPIIEPRPSSTGKPAETVDSYLELKDISFTASRALLSARAASTLLSNALSQRTSRASSYRTSACTPY